MSGTDRTRRIVVILTLITTIVAAVVAGLQVEADTQADSANRQSELLVLQTTARQVSDAYLENYQTALVKSVLADTQEGLTLDLAALKRTAAGDATGSAQLTSQALSKRARAERAMALSDIYQDPALAPAGPNGFPNVAKYFADRIAGTQQLLTEQNAAADTYNMWSSRSGTYVAILSILAVTFFLLGPAQIGRRMRPFLAASASGLLVVSVVWAATTSLT
jgi:hypothetical protein